MTAQRPRNTYITDSVQTASPQRLLVMLYDRLILDLDRALLAIDATDRSASHDALVHAQDIIAELQASLNVEVWPAGKHLAAVYDYVTERLVEANIKQDVAIVTECRDLLEPLRSAWREAAGLAVNAA